MAALAMTGGCGDNDNSDNGNDNGGPGPVRTATPGPVATPTTIAATATPVTAPTATPGETTTQTVDFDFTAANGIQAFQVRVAYPTAKGSFTGEADQVACTVTGGGGIFTKNDNDAAGTLTLSVANTSNLTFPVNVECSFDATSAITSDDLTVTVQEVTQDNGPGNIADLTVTTTVS
ncbi:MAG: hypothetical protein IT293_04335 [Deltaproteobacteria bacterium]|nr:hypothetical protein [Deltaproteobacteria bacterium]